MWTIIALPILVLRFPTACSFLACLGFLMTLLHVVFDVGLEDGTAKGLETSHMTSWVLQGLVSGGPPQAAFGP